MSDFYLDFDTISKYKENIILFTEENMVNRGKIKNTISVVLKREY